MKIRTHNSIKTQTIIMSIQRLSNKITCYFEEMKCQDIAKIYQSQEDCIEWEIKTSTGSRQRAQREHKSEIYLEERNQKKLEKKHKRSEAAAKRESRIVDVKPRWYDNFPAFNPNRGLRDKTLETAQWKNFSDWFEQSIS